jgi:hypothetical protein
VSVTADESFCWLHKIVANREASRCYESRKQTLDVFRKILEQRDVLCSRTNSQMKLESASDYLPLLPRRRGDRSRMVLQQGHAEIFFHRSGCYRCAFLVLHTAEPSLPQKIVPLGIFDLPSSQEQQPASVLLLRANPGLMDRINQEVERAKRNPLKQ